jgi:hypothetical protein
VVCLSAGHPVTGTAEPRSGASGGNSNAPASRVRGATALNIRAGGYSRSRG